MTLEELKIEADYYGYYLTKKPKPPGKLKKHCGKYPMRAYNATNVRLPGELYFGRKTWVECKVCGKRIEHVYTNHIRQDEMRADIGRLWNEMVEAEENR